MVDPITVITAVHQAVEVFERAKRLYDQAKDTLSEEDAAEIEKALASLQAQNDELHKENQARLRGSSATE